MVDSKNISVIMPVYLGEYSGCANDRENKFIRAINSFVNQNYSFKHLVIVSDGCSKSEAIYNSLFIDNKDISFIKIPKQLLFAGAVRQSGIDYIKKSVPETDIVCYLDSDDRFGENHLLNIANNFDLNKYDWVYFNDWVYINSTWINRNVYPEYSHIGTSSFAHKIKISVDWNNGYGHDWRLIEKLLNLPHSKIDNCEYYVCHFTNGYDV